MPEYLSKYLRASHHLSGLALVSTAALVLGLRHTLGIPFSNALIFVLLAWVVMSAMAQRVTERASDPRGAETVYFIYCLFSGVCATLVTHYTSGVEWIGPIFYCFVVIYSNLLLRPVLGAVVVVWSVALYATVAVLEYHGILPHHHLWARDPNLYRNVHYVTAMVGIAGMLLMVLGHAVSCFAQALARERTKQEEANEKLTWLTEHLEHLISERTAELRDVQDRLIEAGKSAAVGQLASGLAREFNNPLTVVKGFADLIRNRYGDALEQGGEELAPLARYVEEIRRGAERCQSIVQAITQFGNPTADCEWSLLDISDIVVEAVAAEHQHAQRADVLVLTDLSENLPQIEGSAELMQQAVAELVSNALDASARGDYVRVTTTAARDSDGVRGVRIAVEDFGPGIGPDELPRIFDPFYSGRPTETRMGLGLSLCQAIVRRHRGVVEAENLPNAGAKFMIELPARDRQQNAAPAADLDGGQARSLQALNDLHLN